MSGPVIDLGALYPGTDIPQSEIYGMGVTLLNTVGCVIQLGHVSPASTLDYWHHIQSIPEAMVRDYVAWTSGRLTAVDADPGERLRDVVRRSGWLAQQSAQLGLGATA